MNNKKPAPALVYAVSIAIPVVLGAVSGLVSMDGMRDYAKLVQPALSPPGWLFPVVWTVLYTLMGISAARIFLTGSPEAKPALIVYFVQLAFNLLWTPIFFALELRLVAFVWLLILIGLVIKMIGDFKKIDAPAGNLQFPYLIWLLFAGYLNLATFLLNR